MPYSPVGRVIAGMLGASAPQAANAAGSVPSADDDNDLHIIKKPNNGFETDSNENEGRSQRPQQTRPLRNYSTEAGSLAEVTAMAERYHHATRDVLSRQARNLAEDLSQNIIPRTDSTLVDLGRFLERQKRETLETMPVVVLDSVTDAIRPVLEQMKSQIKILNAMQHSRSAEIHQMKEMEQRVTDTTVESLWKQLGYKVRDLARKLAKLNVSEKHLSQTAQSVLKTITPECKALLSDDELNESVLSAYIWRLLSDNIFDGSEAFFGNSPRLHLKKLRASLIWQEERMAHPEAFNAVVEWLCGSPLSTSQDMLLKECKTFSTQVLKDIYTFLKRPHQDTAHERIFEDLLSTVRLAVKLDNILETSRSIFHVYYSSEERILFEEDRMEAEVWNALPDEDTEVHFMISPLLVKFGDAEGRHYDDYIRLGKAAVVCK